MKKTSFNTLYKTRQDLIALYLRDTNKDTRREVNRLIKSLTRILEATYKK